jgi:hypothetical protein
LAPLGPPLNFGTTPAELNLSSNNVNDVSLATTALATLGLSQSRGSTQAMRLGVTALQANVLAYTRTSSGDMPAALGTLLMVAHATGADPTDFGGVDLRRQLLASMQK